jgi:hypothetical protein
MRRTFNDLARVANVEALITKSIPGHQTDRMREHYSTVTPEERHRSIGNVVRLFGRHPLRRGVGRAVGRVLAKWGGNEKSRSRPFANGSVFLRFLVGAIGIEPTTPTVSN